jgi:hypothetical protein
MKARNHGSPILGEMRQDIDRYQLIDLSRDDLRDDPQAIEHPGDHWGVFLPLS